MKGVKAHERGSGSTPGSWCCSLALCGPQLEAALEGPGLDGVSCLRLAGSGRRSSLVLAALDLLVEDAGIEVSAICSVAVSRGPGSFTGIRAGLATAFGLRAAQHVEVSAFNSLLMQAARLDQPGRYMTAQPGRRGEVYTRCFEVGADGRPNPAGEIEIRKISDLPTDLPWLAPEALELGDAPRVPARYSAAEALLRLLHSDIEREPLEAFYLEGPPIHGSTVG